MRKVFRVLAIIVLMVAPDLARPGFSARHCPWAPAGATHGVMSDLALRWDAASTSADLAVEANDLARDAGLRTAVLLSLFTDRRAEDGDVLPPGETDRRGWWADSVGGQGGDRAGSRLWLLAREKASPAALARAETYAREALQWLIEDRVAERVDVSASIPQPGVLGLVISIWRPHSKDAVWFRFDHVWRSHESESGGGPTPSPSSLAITSPDHVSSYWGGLDPVTVTISGQASPGSIVGLSVNSMGAGSATAGPDGQWTADVTAQPGRNSIAAWAAGGGGALQRDEVALFVLPNPGAALNLTPDANGDVYVEDHSSDPADYTDSRDSDLTSALLPVSMADDGPMGQRFLRRAGEWAPPEWPDGRADLQMSFTRLLDQTQPIRWRYRMRLDMGVSTWMGAGVLYPDEVGYNGMTASKVSTDGSFRLAAYGAPEIPRDWSPGDVIDVEMEFSRDAVAHTHAIRFRAKLAGESVWSDWYTNGGNGNRLQWPLSLYWQRGDLHHPTSVQDIGTLRAAGRPLAGTVGIIGWKRWARGQIVYLGGADGVIEPMGGVTGLVRPRAGGDPMPAYSMTGFGPPMTGGVDDLIAVGGDFELVSPPIRIQSGFRYRELRLQVYNVSSPSAGSLRIEVRNAHTGDLLPDGQVPGNSTGIVSSAPAKIGDGFPAGTPTQEVDLRGVPSGVTVFLVAHGTVTAGVGLSLMPRVGALTVGFEAIP